MKKRFNYFDAFVEFADKAFNAAEMLDTAIKEFDPANILAHQDAIHAIEHEADRIKHSVVGHLSREFVSPIEREDIISLVEQMDNVVDAIDEVIRLISMFKIKRMRSDIYKFTELLVKGCSMLREAATEFKNYQKPKNLKEKLIQINSIESQADTLHFAATSELFETEANAVLILAWQKIYDMLETCFDDCENVAEVMESVMLKNS